MKDDLKANDVAISSDGSEEEGADDELVIGEDEDTVESIEHVFKLNYKVQDETVVTLKKDYALSICHDSGFTCVATGMSNGSAQIIDLSNGGATHLYYIKAPIDASGVAQSTCGVRFLDDSSNCLLMGNTNGLVRLFDLRASIEKPQASFVDETSGKKNITCFDRNANSYILCTGSREYQDNVCVLFYDLRKRKLYGGYFDSHHCDITTVAFHDTNPDILCSGSTDGLINIYNMREPTEEDALTTTINTENSVQKLRWHRNADDKEIISCITHMNDFKLYEADEGDEIIEFERLKIAEAMKRKNPANCNLISVHGTTEGDLFLLCGSNYNKGEILRSMQLQGDSLMPLANFNGNKQIVRDSVYNKSNQAVITAGETGIITLWMPQTSTPALVSESSQLKVKTKPKSKKSTPY